MKVDKTKSLLKIFPTFHKHLSLKDFKKSDFEFQLVDLGYVQGQRLKQKSYDNFNSTFSKSAIQKLIRVALLSKGKKVNLIFFQQKIQMYPAVNRCGRKHDLN